MQYTIKAKPTKYGQTQFRSRLEARWAAMFDLLGWDFIYEPFDLDYWSPDFLILGKCKVLVEVKPILQLDESIAEKMRENMARWMDATGGTDWRELLLLGVCPFCEYEHDLCMGWCAEIYMPDPVFSPPEAKGRQFWWAGAVPGIWSDNNPSGVFGYCHAQGQFKDRITGGYDGGCHGGADYEGHLTEWQSLWAQAGNLTQWHPGGVQR